jgi:hypothetical protein
MKYKGKLIRGMHKWKQVAFNDKLNKFLEETQRVKPFNYDSVFIDNSEYKKQNTSSKTQIRLNTLSMEERDANL